MKSRLVKIFAAVACLFLMNVGRIQAVEVTLLVDEEVNQPSALQIAERNLSDVLTEINRAQAAREPLTTRNFKMDDFALKSLLRLWAVTPFYCDDQEVVEHCWVFENNTMMVSHIPLIITPVGEDFGSGTYQEAVVEFNARGQITDFRLALDAHMSESFDKCGSVVEEEKKMIIMQYIERFRTAYNQRDIKYIEQIFSDDALIITGKVTNVRAGSDSRYTSPKVQYTRQTKEQYIRNLRRAFIRNKWINVKFSPIEGRDEQIITRSDTNKQMYGVRLLQEWNSSNYSDVGYLFLLWEFPEDGGEPCIHVRTWQPAKAGNQRLEPDQTITTLGGFDL